MKGVNQKEFSLDFYDLLRFATSMLFIIAGRSDKRVGIIIQSEVVIARLISKNGMKPKFFL
jgi:hypothetical protein